ncbi:unnamed protein product [Bursaphelenchus xylophilus]|uniref:(pine wood nematode) hypothetical protein n=1 Tax=Bursaphelenchus xylophilus TaxID=6326 RepID=A0A1I7RMS2_BURXY|nr:unnamed protein product [Bursaphelenchus xylophilus]CAG9125527.1 unnamed protein product [Bursaphelenchus xylophilus]
MCRARRSSAKSAKGAKAKVTIKKDTYASLMKKIINDRPEKWADESDCEEKENVPPCPETPKVIKTEDLKSEPTEPTEPVPEILLCECCSPPMNKYSEEHMHQFYNPNSTYYQMNRSPIFFDEK